jgi:predicted nucleotidyltransferase
LVRQSIFLSRDPRLVRYSPHRFALFKEKRRRALPFLEALPAGSRLFGSVARGDVREASDLDIEVPAGVASFEVELSLSRMDEPVVSRALVQATPNAVVKAVWSLGEVAVSLPLTRPNPSEADFASFAGAVGLEHVKASKRVPGVDKRLLFIEPVEAGHRESSVADRVGEAAKVLGIDAEVIRGRVRVLSRRAQKGRTGIYMNEPLADGDSPEEVLAALGARDPALRRASGGRH